MPMALERTLVDGARAELVPVLRWYVRGGVPILQQGCLKRMGGYEAILEWADVETVVDDSLAPVESSGREHGDGAL